MSPAHAPGCDDTDPNALTLEEALARIEAALVPVSGFEQLPLRSALDRVVAEAVVSPLDVPGYANSAMDGYALRAADLAAEGETALQVVGTAYAGAPYAGPALRAGEALRIMTGAKMPAGADTVVMQEQTEREGDTVRIAPGQRAGQNVRHPGEDVARGATVLAPGRRLTPADLGLLASLGIPEVRVVRRVRVAILSTGDELRSLGEPLGEGQIYDSNRYTLHGMLSRLGVELIDMGVVPDRREAIRAAFEQAAANADVLITSGGVSVGEADFVKETLEAVGEVAFWKIAMKPGKPLAFGRVGKAWFFGLPGNPVSVMATFYHVVQPALRRLAGGHAEAPLRVAALCTNALKKRPGRLDFQRGVLGRDETGRLTVTGLGGQGSHMLSSMSRADCFIVLPAAAGGIEAGTEVQVEPFASFV